MREFFTAAFPWIITGLCVAVLAVQLSRKRSKAKDGEKKENYMAEGMCVDMCVGMCGGANLGFLGIYNSGVGLCICMLVGEVIGMIIPKEKDDDRKRRD